MYFTLQSHSRKRLIANEIAACYENHCYFYSWHLLARKCKQLFSKHYHFSKKNYDRKGLPDDRTTDGLFFFMERKRIGQIARHLHRRKRRPFTHSIGYMPSGHVFVLPDHG